MFFRVTGMVQVIPPAETATEPLPPPVLAVNTPSAVMVPGSPSTDQVTPEPPRRAARDQ